MKSRNEVEINGKMDKTQSFKAAVMTIKVQRKGELDKNRILPKAGAATTRDEFAKQAKDVVNKITNLRNILIENRAAYMRIGQHLRSSAHMSDEQRDLIDRESEKFFTFYTQHLGQLRSDWKRAKRKPQQREHIEAVIELLTNYLRCVQQIHTQQKKYRVQYELETYRLMKLASDKKVIPVRPGGFSNSEDAKKLDNKNNVSEPDAGSEVDWNDGWDIEDEDEENTENNGSANKQNNLNISRTSDIDGKSISSQQVALDEDMQKSQQLVDDEAKGLSPEDVQMFEEENVQLLHELQGLSEEVDQIEKNVVDIAQLQDIFTEKVYTQQQNIERIANAVVGATENVKDGNEQIIQAIQRNAGLRVWSLFFLLVMSFALLFLDWYYD